MAQAIEQPANGHDDEQDDDDFHVQPSRLTKMVDKLASLFGPVPLPMPNPVRQAERGRFYDPFGNTIDTSRPTIQNADGSVSTERTLTDLFSTPEGQRWLNYPSIVDGRQLEPAAATDALLQGRNAPVGVFESLPTAEKAAQQRTHFLGILEALGYLSNGVKNGR